MEVLKIEYEGLTASFRYPYYTWGRQPTFLMPPPSTIYGLISSVFGYWIDPTSILFGYHFTYRKKSEDLEHIHAVQKSKGYFQYLGQKYPKNLEGNINPITREFLSNPKLILYINRPDLYNYFLEPRYPPTLGRSQDLLVLNKIEKIELKKSNYVYFENTLLPWEFRPLTKKGISVMMPRFIDTENEREVFFDRFIILQQLLYSERNSFNENISSDHCLTKIDGKIQEYWYDPLSEMKHEAHRGVIFHSFIK